jgi:DNA polymerase I
MKRLVVIDVSNFIFRAFFAIRPLTAPDGTPVNAVYGVLSMLHRLIVDMKPTHVLCARDTKDPSFRKELFENYKANRSEPPDDLIPQFTLIDELLEKLHLPSLALSGFEADDVIGSVVTQLEKDFDEVLIASGDKDLMQFVNDRVKMLDTMKEKTYGPQDVEDKMGVPPSQIVDYLSIIGDTSDNIPGIPGIGPKGASALLKQFSTLEEVLAGASEVKAKRTSELLKEHADLARLSKKLVQIKCDIKLPFSANDLSFEFRPDNDLSLFLNRLGFKSFLAKIGPIKEEKNAGVLEDSRKLADLKTANDLTNFLNKAKSEVFVYPIFTEDLSPFAVTQAIGIGHKSGLGVWINPDEKKLWTILSDSKLHIIAWDLKPIWIRFLRFHASITTGEDLSQMSFVIAPDSRHDLDTLNREVFGTGLSELESQAQGDLLTPQVDSNAVAQRLQILEAGHKKLQEKLKELNLEAPYKELDLPLLEVLARMELKGITLDVDYFHKLSQEFSIETEKIEKEVEALAGHPINLKSPKQISQLLFEELSLPVIKKTKTGYSTDADVLEELAAMKTNPIPEMLLRYREIEKLNSTYAKVLPTLVAEDGRLHTHFRPANAATGRLSSDNPNLQNIPVRTESGRRLRKGFVAAKGKILLAADYSQVELRILAHFTEDPVMLQAFADDKDIHIQTAAEIFDIDIKSVTKEQRSSAKAINFGLMYGQTGFGLSNTLKISQSEARDYIKMYFQRFGRVKGYLDSLKEFAEKNGYAETMFGRKRFLPEIQSQNRQVKSMAERIAINSPIQGTAADIIKLAMIQLQKDLLDKKLDAQLILQVHDELILELPPSELEEVSELVKTRMENAVKLRVPLNVDMGSGSNWFELK